MSSSTLEDDFSQLLRSINTREISGFRNRVLIQIAAATGMELQALCQLKIWQLTYWHTHNTLICKNPFRHYIQCPAPSGYPLGIYENDKFQPIIPLQLKNRHSISRYVHALGDDAFGDAFLFPKIKRGGKVDLNSPISAVRAGKILTEVKTKMPTACDLSWPKIKQICIIRHLLDGHPKEYIIHNSAYNDAEYVNKVGKALGIQVRSNRKFVRDCKIGYDYEGSFLTRNERWYKDRIPIR